MLINVLLFNAFNISYETFDLINLLMIHKISFISSNEQSYF